VTALKENVPVSFGRSIELAAIEIKSDVTQNLRSLSLRFEPPFVRESVAALSLYRDAEPFKMFNESDSAIGEVQTDVVTMVFDLDEEIKGTLDSIEPVTNNFILVAKVEPEDVARENDKLGIIIEAKTGFGFSVSGSAGPSKNFSSTGPIITQMPEQPVIKILVPDRLPPTRFDDQGIIDFSAVGPNPEAKIMLYYAEKSNYGPKDVDQLRASISIGTSAGVIVLASAGADEPDAVSLTVGSEVTSIVWDTHEIPEGTYTIYGIIEDFTAISSDLARSFGKIEVRHDVDISNLSPKDDTAVTDGSFVIQWNDKKNRGNARINLFYSPLDLSTADVVSLSENAELIVVDLSEDDDGTLGQYKWDFTTARVPESKDGVYIYAIISDRDSGSKTEKQIKQKAVRSDGKVIITYPPLIKLISPIREGSKAITEFTLSWLSEDLDNNGVSVSLYYHQRHTETAIDILIDSIGNQSTSLSGTIAEGVSATPTNIGQDSYSWDIQSFESENGVNLNGSYYIYARIADSSGNEGYDISSGTLTIRKVQIRLRPNALVAGPGEEFDVAVQLRSSAIAISGASIYLTFDDRFLQVGNAEQPFRQLSSSDELRIQGIENPTGQQLEDYKKTLVFDFDDAEANQQEILENDNHGDTVEDSMANGISGYQLDYSVVVKNANSIVKLNEYRTLAKIGFKVKKDVGTRPINTTISFDFDEATNNRSTSVVAVNESADVEDISPIAVNPALRVQVVPYASITGKILLEGRQDHSSLITFALRRPGQMKDIPIGSSAVPAPKPNANKEAAVSVDQEVITSITNDEDPALEGIQITPKPDGTYTINGIPTGTWELVAKAPSYIRGQYMSKTRGTNSYVLRVVPGDKLQDINIYSQGGKSQRLTGGDVDNDNRINIADLSTLMTVFGTVEGSDIFNKDADINNDGKVNLSDFSILARNFGKLGVPPTVSSGPPPAAAPSIISDVIRLSMPITPEVVQMNEVINVSFVADFNRVRGYAFEVEYDPQSLKLIEDSVQEGELFQENADRSQPFFISRDYETNYGTRKIIVANMIAGNEDSIVGSGSLAKFRFIARTDNISELRFKELTIVGDDQNLVKLPDVWNRSIEPLKVPSQTELIQNYPNPFNPETWIPYRLSQPSPVTIMVYDATGQQIRRIDIGIQPVGDYTRKNHAIYWDGQNDFGEKVASGVYFYELVTNHYDAIKKMVILK
ncbi:TPA: T9SS type A sorting domain-containing protein, partial [Candidatus Poribacteria bacterium]|nr:T9SS type A sorting domain-containing protein [Candidatus Poribacteria bacterium]